MDPSPPLSKNDVNDNVATTTTTTATISSSPKSTTMTDTSTTTRTSTATVNSTTSSTSMIHLTEEKQFSRLLYTNPVCFLCTMIPSSQPLPSTNRTVSSVPSSSPTNTTTTVARRSPNVMVVTWLTATNNRGQFLMSINRHRYTSTFFVKQQQQQQPNGPTDSHHFTLCVPVQGMEDLIRAVGSTSGRWCNKFPSSSSDQSNHQNNNHDGKSLPCSNGATEEGTTKGLLSRRQKQKKLRRHHQYVHGIPGLKAVPFGHYHHHPRRPPSSSSTSTCNIETNNHTATKNETSTATTNTASSSSSSMVNDDDDDTNEEEDKEQCFVIDGTVAHLKCQMIWQSPSSSFIPNATNPATATTTTKQQVPSMTMLDEDHYLIVGQVVDAYCHCSYWDPTKNLFRPQTSNVPPYLTFFGSQTFGYVTTTNTNG